MIVENETIKDGYSSFMIKCGTTRGFIENHRVLFDPFMQKSLSNVMSLRTFHLSDSDIFVGF